MNDPDEDPATREAPGERTKMTANPAEKLRELALSVTRGDLPGGWRDGKNLSAKDNHGGGSDLDGSGSNSRPRRRRGFDRPRWPPSAVVTKLGPDPAADRVELFVREYVRKRIRVAVRAIRNEA